MKNKFMLTFGWLSLLFTSLASCVAAVSSSGNTKSENKTLNSINHSLSSINQSLNDSLQNVGQMESSSIKALFRIKPRLKNDTSFYIVPAVESFSPQLQRPPKQSILSSRNSLYSSVSSSIQSSDRTRNNQNFKHLISNVVMRLKNIKNIEMRVTIVQDIFDAVALSIGKNVERDSNINTVQNYSNLNANIGNLRELEMVALLQAFSKRLSKKLLRATHVVFNLRDFFFKNVSKIFTHKNSQSADLSENGRSFADEKNEILNTFIKSLEDVSSDNADLRYNSTQIRVFNFLGTQYPYMPRKILSSNASELSDVANRWLVDKIHSLLADVGSQSQNLPLYSVNSSRLLCNNFKHIYFLSRYDSATDLSMKHMSSDLHFRYLYASAIKHKYVLLLIDVGSSMTGEHFRIVKKFVGTILNLLSEDDLISIVTIASKTYVFVPKVTSVNRQSEGAYFATRDHKDKINTYLNRLLVGKELTNHSLAFECSFKLLEKLKNLNLITKRNPVQFLYITRIMPLNFSITAEVLSTIAKGQQKLLNPIKINTCAVVEEDESHILNGNKFLLDIAQQNYWKYEIGVRHSKGGGNWHNISGKCFVIVKKHPEQIERISTAVFDHLFIEPFLSKNLRIHTPVVDSSGRDTIVSLTHVVSPFGVVGVNLFLIDLVEDVVNYIIQNVGNRNESSYAFLIDRTGVTLAHPALSSPSALSETPYAVDIAFLENATDFFEIRKKMLFEDHGNRTTTVFISNFNENTILLNRTYFWQRVRDVYIMCLAITFKVETDGPLIDSKTHKSTELPVYFFHNVSGHYDNRKSELLYNSPLELLYHRLDLLPEQNLQVCRYFRQMGTFDYCTVYLSPSAFESPFEYLQNSRRGYKNHENESIIAYLKHTTGFLANPGLRTNIRNDATTVYKAMQHLKKRHLDPRGGLKNFIIRRYIATVSGVLLVFPGCILPSNFEPASRTWFQKAFEHPGKIVITEPYVDAAGAGYIVTIAHTIFRRRSNALNTRSRDTIVAVISLDLPYAFFYKLLIDAIPLCRERNVKCLLFENKGYLVAHPSMLEPSGSKQNQRRPHEHLTHKESFLANDILYHKNLVKKAACVNYQNRTIQRYWIFNTSLTEVLSNVVHGERTKYTLALVQGTNIFATILNSTAEGGAFCPCSTIDRICLNCNRMDPSDCECPCECPMNFFEQVAFPNKFDKPSVKYAKILNNYTYKYPYCQPENKKEFSLSTKANMFRSCSNISCDVFNNQDECLAVIDCEWCQLDIHDNKLTSAFCTSQQLCFNGVLSSHSPYNEDDEGSDILAIHDYNMSQDHRSYTVFGPICCALIVFVLFIGCFFYFYRYNQGTLVQHQFYSNSIQDENNGVPLSRLNLHYSPPIDEASCCGNGKGSSRSANHRIEPANVSPYNMSSASGYHRPKYGESDHGYSTMTPYEDYNDQQSSTLVVPLLSTDKNHRKSDSISISNSILSLTNRHQQYPNTHITMYTAQRDKSTSKHFKTNSKDLNTSVSTNKIFEQTNVQNCGMPTTEDMLCRHFILAPVTVHRLMETSEL